MRQYRLLRNNGYLHTVSGIECQVLAASGIHWSEASSYPIVELDDGHDEFHRIKFDVRSEYYIADNHFDCCAKSMPCSSRYYLEWFPDLLRFLHDQSCYVRAAITQRNLPGLYASLCCRSTLFQLRGSGCLDAMYSVSTERCFRRSTERSNTTIWF